MILSLFAGWFLQPRKHAVSVEQTHIDRFCETVEAGTATDRYR